MAVNDAPTFDAAFSATFGFLLGSIPGPVMSDVTNCNTIANAFATAIDTAVLGAGGAGVNANRAVHMAAIIDNFFKSKANNPFLAEIVEGLIIGSPLAVDTVSTRYTTVANRIAAAYVASVSQLQ